MQNLQIGTIIFTYCIIYIICLPICRKTNFSKYSIKDISHHIPLAIIPFVLMLAGCVLLLFGLIRGFRIFGIVGCIISGLSGFATMFLCIVRTMNKINAYRNATETVRQWVEFNLNQKYQNQYGIRWNIFEERVITGYGKKRRMTMYLHIVVECIDGAEDTIIMQQPHQEIQPVYNPNEETSPLQPLQIAYLDHNEWQSS